MTDIDALLALTPEDVLVMPPAQFVTYVDDLNTALREQVARAERAEACLKAHHVGHTEACFKCFMAGGAEHAAAALAQPEPEEAK